MSAKGIVAPDFDGRAIFNTLRVRPEYRITLRLGEIEELFVHKPDSKEGRMERLQVLGLFYFPLKHIKAADRYDAAWAWFKDKILGGGKSDADADKAIQSALKCRVVSGAAIPAWDGAASALPPDAEDPAAPKAENFAKIRIPGGYTFQWFGIGVSPNKDPAIPGQGASSLLHDHEAKFYEQNLALGRIPLVAKVEKRPTPSDDWQPAKDAAVHFQILPSYAVDTPAYVGTDAASAQFARPPLRSTLGDVPDSGSGIGPKKAVDAEEARNADPKDPQGANCHKDRGGKRGEGNLNDNSDVAGVLFETTSRKGFNDASHPDSTRKISHKPFPLAAAATVSGEKHKHAVKALTNEDGEAGVIFTPSRMGGDRYRLRAYVGPPTLTSDGADPAAAAVTTGTFIVWRNIRVSRYLRQKVTSTPDSRLVEQAVGAPVDDAKRTAYLRSFMMVGRANSGDASDSVVPLEKADFTDPAPEPNPFDAIPRQLARAFCEVEMDSGSRDPEDLSQADWDAARAAAVKDIEDAAASGGPNLNYKTLFCLDGGFNTLKVDEAGVHLPMRSPAAYNAADASAATPKPLNMVSGAVDPTLTGPLRNLSWFYGIGGILRYLSKDGALPGLTVLYGGLGTSWQVLGIEASNSGIGLQNRACVVWYGTFFYGPRNARIYDLSSNTLHEMSHIMFRKHAPGRPTASVAGGNDASQHDPIADCLCVMSYDTCTGQLCGKCLLMLRGWKTA